MTLNDFPATAGRFSGLRLFNAKPALAAIPAGGRVYAVGDIHGRLDLLQNLWSMIREDAAQTSAHKVVVLVGDYVDRGPDSKGVIEFLLNARIDGGVVLCLRGNHDQSVLDFVADASFYRSWKPFGAPETLVSYGVAPPRFEDENDFERARIEFLQKCPPRHLRFLSALPYSQVIGGYFFTHAGARPGIGLDEQDPQDMLWIRDEFLDARAPFDKVVVHGHTPQERARRHSSRIGVDTGAYATGRLTAAVLEGTDCRFLST